jgi:hypothetical protein
MLKGHLPRVIYHQVYACQENHVLSSWKVPSCKLEDNGACEEPVLNRPASGKKWPLSSGRNTVSEASQVGITASEGHEHQRPASSPQKYSLLARG